MNIRVTVEMGYDTTSFDFDNEEAAVLFAGTARKHLHIDKDDEGKSKKSKVVVEFLVEEEDN